MPTPYAELHCRSNFSFLTGASHPQELVARAQALGYSALALTDEGSLGGVVRAHEEAKQCGLHLGGNRGGANRGGVSSSLLPSSVSNDRLGLERQVMPMSRPTYLSLDPALRSPACRSQLPMRFGL